MNNYGESMFSFSAKLYYDKRRINKHSGEASLSLQVIIEREHKPFPLKLRWPVDKIDLEKQILLPRMKKDPDVQDYNLIIQSERAKYTEIQKAYRLRNEDLSLDKFKAELKVFNDRESFSNYLERESKRRHYIKDICKKNMENVHAVKLQVLAYDPVPSFKNINTNWMEGFKTYLTTKEYKPGKFYKQGTIWDRIRVVKAYLNRASKEPMIYVNESAIQFTNKEPKYETVYLNKEEITRLIILHSSGGLTQIEYNVLSAFLFTCFTSLRISDVYRANSRWQVSKTTLKFMPQKNIKSRKVIEIPIMSMAKQFIINIHGLYFELPSKQEYNRTLKDLAIKSEIFINLTSHVGRHTFGFLFMTTVGNIYALKEILGHEKIETTLRYAHLNRDYLLESVKSIESSFTDVRVIGMVKRAKARS